MQLLFKKTTPITAAAKQKLREYFIAENWPLDTPLLRGADDNLDSRLRAIKTKFDLNKPQIARQLKNFKEEKYGNSQITLIIDADQLEE